MPCEDKCKYEDRIKVIEENIAVLSDLFAREDVFVRGDVFIRGRILNQQGSVPSVGPALPGNGGGPTTCILEGNGGATTITVTITAQNACSTYILPATTTIPAIVFFNSQTPAGTYTFTNQSTSFQITVTNIDAFQFFTVSPQTSATFTFSNGTLTQIS